MEYSPETFLIFFDKLIILPLAGFGRLPTSLSCFNVVYLKRFTGDILDSKDNKSQLIMPVTMGATEQLPPKFLRTFSRYVQQHVVTISRYVQQHVVTILLFPDNSATTSYNEFS